MPRDLDLIRKLVLYFNAKSDFSHIKVPPIPGWDDSAIKYHCLLLYQAGMLDCEPVKSTTSDRVISVIPFNLTWKGCEFAALSHSDTIWSRANAGITAAFGAVTGISVELLTQYLKHQAANLLGMQSDS
jgi:hypothetical protein